MGEKKANEVVNVREVSIMKMHPDKLAQMAEEELGEYPWEMFEENLEKPLEDQEERAEEELGEYPWEMFEENLEKPLEDQEEEDYCILDSPLFKMTEDELYERSLWYFEQQEEENEYEGLRITE
ncbi:hypothetical protein SAMN05880501_10871 [Ureibacillus xyleni]|uniref:Uncharacterized protein n=1 Tax=Ureibacillus xyleni TaxID=614648 RepID=A0A285T2I3_9BACL|nr:hypothetical protein SAMN05880501_10871 [Ureibacillus xyleni]